VSDTCRRRYFPRGLEGQQAELSATDAREGATGIPHRAGLDVPGGHFSYSDRCGGNSDWHFDLDTALASGGRILNPSDRQFYETSRPTLKNRGWAPPHDVDFAMWGALAVTATLLNKRKNS
jgi:hypothetical protein